MGRLRKLLPEPGVSRVLNLATLINTVGRGLQLTSTALFLNRSVGLSAQEIGLGLSIAALVTLVANTPMGYLADRYGPRGMMVGFLVVQGFLSAGLVTVRSFPGFVLFAGLLAVVDAGSRGARGALIAGAIPPDQRVRTRAYLRATTNVGISIGAALAGFGLAADTRGAYVALILGDAVTFLIAAAIMSRVPAIAPVPRPAEGPRLVALRDRAFLGYTAIDGLMSMHFDILNIVLPLWVATHTDAPRWLVSVLFLVNTTMVVLFQVRAARGTERLAGAVRATRVAGLLIAGACLLYAGSAGVPAWVAVTLLVAGSFVHVLGELRQSAAGWGISFGLAPDGAQGQYQGAYSMGMQLGRMVGPTLLTGVVLGLGRWGWAIVAVLFVGLGLAVAPVVRWAERTRPATAGAAV